MPKKIYVDHAATTPLDKEVLAAMKPYFWKKFGNPSSIHSFGMEAREALEESREKIAKLLGAQSDEIIFTSGGSEADNLAIKGTAFGNMEKGKHIITSSFEHDAVLHACDYLKKFGFKVTKVPVTREGFVKPEEIEKAIRKDTVLITIMHANNEIGTIQPISEIGKIASECEIAFHTDAVQTVGKMPVDVKKLKVDMLSLSAHKFYGPKGVGCLYIKNGTKLDAQIHGGGHEHGFRSGTENVAGAVGAAKALELATRNMEKWEKKERKLRDMLIDGILPMGDCWLNGTQKNRLAGNLNISFSYIEGESIILYLDKKGIAASTGSACSSKSLQPSHVLTAIGLSPEQAHGSLRLTLGKDNTKEQVEYVLKVLSPIIKKLRKMSPVSAANIDALKEMEYEH